MEKIESYTTVYSDQSIEALENLIDAISNLCCGKHFKAKDLFYYGVFCKRNTYLNTHVVPDDVYMPEFMRNENTDIEDKLKYIDCIIDEVLHHKIDKPQWMIEIELRLRETNYCVAPSTFLHIIPKENKYNELANKLLIFLYSPNMLTNLLGSPTSANKVSKW